MDLKYVKEVFNNEQYINSLLQLSTPQQVQQSLKQKDIDLSIDEINQIKDIFERYQNNKLTDQELKVFNLLQESNINELSDDDLENVTGGSIILIGLGLLFCAAATTALVGTTVKVITGRW